MDLIKPLKATKNLDPITPGLRQQYQHWGGRRAPNPELWTEDPTEESSPALGLPDLMLNAEPTTILNFNQSSAPPPLTPAALFEPAEDDDDPLNDPRRITLRAQTANLSDLIEALGRNCFHLQEESIAGLMRGGTRYANRYATAAAGELSGLKERLRSAGCACACVCDCDYNHQSLTSTPLVRS